MVYYCYTNIILIRTRAFSQIFGKDLRETSRVPSGPGAGGPEDGRSHGYPKGLHMIHDRPRQHWGIFVKCWGSMVAFCVFFNPVLFYRPFFIPKLLIEGS